MEYNIENLLALDAQGLSYREIASKLNVSMGKVSGQLSRIRAKNPELVLKRELGKHPQGKVFGKHRPKETVTKKTSAFVELTPRGYKPNRYTIATKPYRYKDMSKADLRDMLKKAVENT